MDLAVSSNMTLLLLYISLALVVSFFCSIFEAVLLSITPSYIANLEKTSPRLAQRLKKQKERIDGPLIAILTFNTLAHTAGAAGAGAQAAMVLGNQYLGLFSAVLTLLILFISEIIPKTIGANYWRSLAPAVSWVLVGLEFITRPLIWFVMMITKYIGKGKHHAYVRQEMDAMADLGHASGELGEQESQILKQMLKATDLSVSAIMTPRTVIFSAPQGLTMQEFSQRYSNNPFSRIPVFDTKMSDIIGYVFRNEILITEKKTPYATLESIKTEILVFPETAKILTAFKKMCQRKIHIALVVNEYGNTLGLLTMEDLIESLLGLEIVESKDPATDMQHLARHLWQERIKEKGIVISEDTTDNIIDEGSDSDPDPDADPPPFKQDK
tara:strand:- start:6551 stop:7702 length:1152 start_codon:yes stop_codon:yes gene_type:complete